ncbi:hypothetical protein Goshw_013102 [Gossypium schwendimanii]|uniref:Reverse transcriptase zinc-binding domain-containing protein n=1 Tax=Gossypium schwendimanii TaxID=34291 RepID=A0A7J9MSR3_GOSSC|nr:hypothetical protein [Gossypium schwendimanii]
MDLGVCDMMGRFLGVWKSKNPEKYLGLPMMVGRGKKQAFAHYFDRFRKKVEGWGMIFFSMGWKKVMAYIGPISVDFAYLRPKGVLGFRDLGKFNIALLAKQCWQIINNGDCLLDKRIGTASGVNIWNDAWISRPRDGIVQYEGPGKYPPKSGYKLLAEHAPQLDIPQSMSASNLITALFRNLWALHIPEKLKITFWRIIYNFLPTFDNLAKRIIQIAKLCPLCKKADETEIWAPLIPNNVKLNYYTSFIATLKRSISSVIARNESGEILAACTYPHYGVADAFTTEARVCEQKVAFAQELGFRSIVV